jgi:hypothetical protein
MKNLRELHISIVRDLLRLKGSIPLSLTRQERHEWAVRGVTLKQRDEAAALLVRWGEAEYQKLRDDRYCRVGSDAVVHLVTVEGGK